MIDGYRATFTCNLLANKVALLQTQATTNKYLTTYSNGEVKLLSETHGGREKNGSLYLSLEPKF